MNKDFSNSRGFFTAVLKSEREKNMNLSCAQRRAISSLWMHLPKNREKFEQVHLRVRKIFNFWICLRIRGKKPYRHVFRPEIGVRVGYHWGTYLCFVSIELDWSECDGQSGIYTCLNVYCLLFTFYYLLVTVYFLLSTRYGLLLTFMCFLLTVY